MYLDEFKGLLSAFENPTLRSKLNETFARFIALIQNAKYIIISDADLDDFSLSIFDSYFNIKVTKIEYTHKKLAGRVGNINTEYESFIHNLLQDLKHKKKVFSPSQSSEKSKKVFESVKIHNENKKLNLKAVLITGNYTELIGYENPYPENNAVLKQHILENFNYFCQTCDYITYTSTITSSVSYDKTTFDKCYAITSGQSNLYRSFVQQLLWIRHVKEMEYEFFVDNRLLKQKFVLPYSYEHCEKVIRTSHRVKNMTIDEIETLKILQCTIPKIDIAKGIKHYEPFAEHVCIHNMKEKLDSKTYYFQMLCSLLEFHGFELNIINGDYDITQNTIEAILIGNDKENLKFHKCRIKRFFNNHIDLELVRLVVYNKGFVRKYMNQKRLLNKLVSRNLEDDEDYEKINFNKLIKDTDIRGDMEAKLQYYVNKILTIMKFKSIFDVMTEVDTEIAMQALRDNVEWFRQLYQLHHSEYEKEKRIEDMPSVHWTDKRWREYINVALNNEYGICLYCSISTHVKS